MSDDLKMTETLINSILTASDTALSIGQLEANYKELENEYIPFSKFGFNSLIEFLGSLKNSVRVEYANGTAQLWPVVAKGVEQIRNFVENQKKHPAKKLAYKINRDIEEKILRILASCPNHRLPLGQLSSAYSRAYSSPLPGPRRQIVAWLSTSNQFAILNTEQNTKVIEVLNSVDLRKYQRGRIPPSDSMPRAVSTTNSNNGPSTSFSTNSHSPSKVNSRVILSAVRTITRTAAQSPPDSRMAAQIKNLIHSVPPRTTKPAPLQAATSTNLNIPAKTPAIISSSQSAPTIPKLQVTAPTIPKLQVTAPTINTYNPKITGGVAAKPPAIKTKPLAVENPFEKNLNLPNSSKDLLPDDHKLLFKLMMKNPGGTSVTALHRAFEFHRGSINKQKLLKWLISMEECLVVGGEKGKVIIKPAFRQQPAENIEPVKSAENSTIVNEVKTSTLTTTNLQPPVKPVAPALSEKQKSKPPASSAFNFRLQETEKKTFDNSYSFDGSSSSGPPASLEPNFFDRPPNTSDFLKAASAHYASLRDTSLDKTDFNLDNMESLRITLRPNATRGYQRIVEAIPSCSPSASTENSSPAIYEQTEVKYIETSEEVYTTPEQTNEVENSNIARVLEGICGLSAMDIIDFVQMMRESPKIPLDQLLLDFETIFLRTIEPEGGIEALIEHLSNIGLLTVATNSDVSLKAPVELRAFNYTVGDWYNVTDSTEFWENYSEWDHLPEGVSVTGKVVGYNDEVFILSPNWSPPDHMFQRTEVEALKSYIYIKDDQRRNAIALERVSTTQHWKIKFPDLNEMKTCRKEYLFQGPPLPIVTATPIGRWPPLNQDITIKSVLFSEYKTLACMNDEEVCSVITSKTDPDFSFRVLHWNNQRFIPREDLVELGLEKGLTAMDPSAIPQGEQFVSGYWMTDIKESLFVPMSEFIELLDARGFYEDVITDLLLI